MNCFNIRTLRLSIMLTCTVILSARSPVLSAYAQEPSSENRYEAETTYSVEPNDMENAEPSPVYLDETWTYASYSAINSGCAYLYHAKEVSAAGDGDTAGEEVSEAGDGDTVGKAASAAGDGDTAGEEVSAAGDGDTAGKAASAAGDGDTAGKAVSAAGDADSVDEEYGAVSERGVTVCVNAGHGTSGGSNEQTLSHPDGSPKVTGGTTAEGAVYSTAISSGTTFLDGTSEADANLMVALALKEILLSDGYDVLMIRDSTDVQLDNIARTVIANNMADIHVAIHFDSTESDKGVYYCSVPDVESYRAMEPVASHWQEHERLGAALVRGFSDSGLTVFGGGSLETDLTQTSYSTIPSVDIEVGDRASSHSSESCEVYARALKKGIDYFFEDEKNS